MLAHWLLHPMENSRYIITEAMRLLAPILWGWGVFLFLFCGTLSAQVATPAARLRIGLEKADRRAEIAQILSALEEKVESHRLPPKVREKLVMLNDERLQLIASLSKQMVEKDSTLAGDVAFLLIATLLIVS